MEDSKRIGLHKQDACGDQDKWKQLLEDEEMLDAFLEDVTASGLASMPAYLEAEILADIHAQAQPQVKTKAKRYVWLPLFGYSVKIGFAAACAILMLFHLPEINVPTDREFQDSINAWAANMENAWADDKENVWVAGKENAWQEEQEKREKRSKRTAYTAAAFEFITNKIFDGGIEND